MADWVKILKTTARILTIVGLLYLFICALDLMSAAFTLLTGKGASGFLASDNSILNNPLVGLMIGILGTVCVQSSSTFTSIIVSMVGANVIEPEVAIPMIMGANIGTSVTNTIVSLTQMGDREQFRRAFAAATVLDMFNWCAVIVMLTLEVATGFLEWLSEIMADALVDTDGASEVKILEYITEPFTNLIIQIDNDCFDYVINTGLENCTLQKRWCPKNELPEVLDDMTTLPYDYIDPKCKNFFNLFNLEDWAAGLILLIFALTTMILALLFMVKILNTLLKGAMAVMVKKVLNPTFEHRITNYMYGYVNIIIGAFLTFIVQSSSVFTSTLTPLVGIGILAIETVYPLFLGSNIGTTTTGLLAALASPSDGLHDALQIAFVHLLFNVSGILMFYPIPFTRIPIPLSKILGKTTSIYRWFAIAYLLVMFLFLPLFIMACSLNTIVFYCTIVPLFFLLLFVAVVNIMQRKCPEILTCHGRVPFLYNWDYLPLPLRSLDPYDRIITGWRCCKKCNEAGDMDIDLEDDEKSLGIRNDSDSDHSSTCEKRSRRSSSGGDQGRRISMFS